MAGSNITVYRRGVSEGVSSGLCQEVDFLHTYGIAHLNLKTRNFDWDCHQDDLGIIDVKVAGCTAKALLMHFVIVLWPLENFPSSLRINR